MLLSSIVFFVKPHLEKEAPPEPLRPVKIFSKLNLFTFGCFVRLNNYLIIKISNSRGDLSDILAKTATLIGTPPKPPFCHRRGQQCFFQN